MDHPTLANWTTPEASRWSFRHVRQLIASTPVPSGTPRPLPRSAQDPRWADRDFLESSHTDAFVVLHEGELVYEWYAPDVHPDDLHIVFSVSKSVTAMLAGALAGANLLDLDAPVAKYVPEVAGSGFANATVRHLLDMTAAINFAEDYSLADDRMLRYRRSVGWAPGTAEIGMHDFLLSLTHDGPPGIAHRYLSPVTDMLGWVCERASGTSFAHALSERIWSPMGAEADAEVTIDRHGAPRAAGGLSMRARDMARVGPLVLDGGRNLIPRWFVDDFFTGGVAEQWANGDGAEHLPGAAHRSCWYELPAHSDVIAAMGIHGQMIYIDRMHRVVIAKQSRWPQAVSKAADEQAIAAARQLVYTLTE